MCEPLAMDDATHDERFTRLEIKAAYLEKLTAELNDVVVEIGRASCRERV